MVFDRMDPWVSVLDDIRLDRDCSVWPMTGYLHLSFIWPRYELVCLTQEQLG